MPSQGLVRLGSSKMSAQRGSVLPSQNTLPKELWDNDLLLSLSVSATTIHRLR